MTIRSKSATAAKLDRGHTTERSSDFVSRNLRVNGRRTSIRLERALWKTFDDIALREGLTTRVLCSAIDQQRDNDMSLTAAVRLFTVSYYRRIVEKLEENRSVSGHHPRRGFAETGQAGLSAVPTHFSPLMQAALAELD